MRTRDCEGDCTDDDTQSEDCNLNSCLELFIWSDWSGCSKSCGRDGVQTRQKLCLFNNAEVSLFTIF